MVGTLRLSRSQIAQIAGNDPEAIRQFEKLFAFQETAISDAQSLSINVGAADNKANEALAQLQRIADALELLANAPPPPANNSVVTDYIDLPEIGPHDTMPRRVQWNADDGTMDVGLYGGSVLQVGQEIHYYVKNTSGATILNGAPVVVTGTLGASGKLTIGLAIADGSIDQRFFIGAATQDIANNAFGYVTSFGLLRGFNTSAYTDGDLLYVSATTDGTWTNVAPSSPNWRQPQSIVVHAAINGSIFIRYTPEHKLTDLQDVSAVAPTNEYPLKWVSSNNRWEPGVLGVAGGGTGTATAFTAGSVIFAGASGTYSQDNANLFWDDTNNRLGIGLVAPTVSLDVAGIIRSVRNAPQVRLTTSTGQGWRIGSTSSGSTLGTLYFQGTTDNFVASFINSITIDATGNVGLGTSTPASTALLDVQSTTKGVRFPNMTTTQKNAITPSDGTVVFDTTLAKLCVYSGAAWQTITSV